MDFVQINYSLYHVLSQTIDFVIFKVLSPYTAWKASKYGVFSSLCFPVFSSNTEKYECVKYEFSECS